MSSSPRTTLRLAALLSLLLPTGASLLPASALAQGTEEQQQACTPDAVKLCSDTIPDIAKTTACMKGHFAQLSPRCQSAFNEATGGHAPAHAAAHDSVTRHREAARHEPIERDRAPAREAPAPGAQEAARDTLPPPVAGYPPFPSPDAPVLRADRAGSARSQIAQACRDGLIDSFTCEHTVPSLFGE